MEKNTHCPAGDASRARSWGSERGIALVALSALVAAGCRQDPGRAEATPGAPVEEAATPSEPEPSEPAQPPADASPAPQEDAPPPRDDKPREDAEPSRPDWGIDAEDAPGGGAIVIGIAGEAATMLDPGDVIVAIDGRRVKNSQDLARALAAAGEGPVLLELRRHGAQRLVGMNLAPRARPTSDSRGGAGADRSRRRAGPGAPAPGAVEPAVAAPQPPATPQVIVIATPPGAPTPIVSTIGGAFLDGAQPPAFSAPGLARTPGATFAPAPGTAIWAYPQLPGISQPPGFDQLQTRPGYGAGAPNGPTGFGRPATTGFGTGVSTSTGTFGGTGVGTGTATGTGTGTSTTTGTPVPWGPPRSEGVGAGFGRVSGGGLPGGGGALGGAGSSGFGP